ncbi:MAG: MFS transporter [Erysipelothrix sp.]|nr:MFS transporter [Erysipelothrix sp.]
MKYTKAEKSWILYDVANSAFILIVTATIPIYFRSMAASEGVADNIITAWFSGATSVAVLLLALVSPVIGAIADYRGMKKKLFAIFLGIGLLGGLALAVTTRWQAFAMMFILARIGYSACNVFYDSMLIDVSSDERMDMVSAQGYAWGYIGSTIPFIAGLILILFTPFNLDVATATKLSFVITIAWWGLLTIPLFRDVKQVYALEPQPQLVRTSFKRVFVTLRKIYEDKALFYYIMGYFLYINGVYTVISQATNFGGEVGIDQNLMIVALLATQFVAFPFAILAGKLANRYGPLKLIKFYMAIYIGVAIFGFQLSEAWEFWFLAIVVGMAQGGIQSLSRSYFGRLIPKNESNEYFGFFDIFGKFSDVLGPLFIAISAVLFQSSRPGILALIVLFIAGYIMIDKVDKLTSK